MRFPHRARVHADQAVAHEDRCWSQGNCLLCPLTRKPAAEAACRLSEPLKGGSQHRRTSQHVTRHTRGTGRQRPNRMRRGRCVYTVLIMTRGARRRQASVSVDTWSSSCGGERREIHHFAAAAAATANFAWCCNSGSDWDRRVSGRSRPINKQLQNSSDGRGRRRQRALARMSAAGVSQAP